jgi:hypothetical protein
MAAAAAAAAALVSIRACLVVAAAHPLEAVARHHCLDKSDPQNKMETKMRPGI